MIDIGSTSFYIEMPSLPRQDLERYSTELFDRWANHVEVSLGLSDYSLELEVEEGSVNGKGKILATLSLLYFGIAQYGSFITGLEVIRDQVECAGNYLADKAGDMLENRHKKPRTRRNGGSLDKLNLLFDKVYSGEMTPDEAKAEADALFEKEAGSAPGFMRDLHGALETVPRQGQLPLEISESEYGIIDQIPRRQRRPSPIPTPELPLFQQFRVGIRQESKNGKRQIVVTKI